MRKKNIIQQIPKDSLSDQYSQESMVVIVWISIVKMKTDKDLF